MSYEGKIVRHAVEKLDSLVSNPEAHGRAEARESVALTCCEMILVARGHSTACLVDILEEVRQELGVSGAIRVCHSHPLDLPDVIVALKDKVLLMGKFKSEFAKNLRELRKAEDAASRAQREWDVSMRVRRAARLVELAEERANRRWWHVFKKKS